MSNANTGGDLKQGPARRSYGQYCALAVALDVIGERWTLLIVRELLVRPRRYAELLESLPGIGTNLLAERLRMLTDLGIIRGVDPGHRRSGYELTDIGYALHEPVLALARWGLGIMTEQAPSDAVRSGWALLGIQALIDDMRAPAIDEEYMFVVDDEVFTIAVRGGHAEAHAGGTESPALTVNTDARTLIDVGSRRLDPMAALVSGRISVLTEDSESMLRCLRLMGLYDAQPAVQGPDLRTRSSGPGQLGSVSASPSSGV